MKPRSIVPLLIVFLFFQGGSPAPAWPAAGNQAVSSAGKSDPLTRAASLIIGEETVSGGAYAKLAWLTDRIGPRLSGSANAEAAVAWALREFRRDGRAGLLGLPAGEAGEAGGVGR
jgi:hypothetical protein